MALGVTWYMPDKDVHLEARSTFLEQMAAMLGGYAAEELIFKEVTTGSSNDLKRVTQLARQMVTEHGMSAKMGPVIFNSGQHSIFLGRDLTERSNYSEQTAALIDQEVEKLVRESYQLARELLSKNKAALEKISAALIQKENLNRTEFLNLLK